MLTLGRAYYTVSDFGGLDKEGVTPDRDLTELEWEGNEIYLDAKTKDETADIIIKTIGVFKAWRSELEQIYPNTRFNMLACYDNGDRLELNEGETPTRSMTFRLWAERGNASSFASANADQWEQPAISEFCNYR